MNCLIGFLVKQFGSFSLDSGFMCMIKRVCLAIVPSEPGGEASVNTHRQEREMDKAETLQVPAVVGFVNHRSSAKPSLCVTVSL